MIENILVFLILTICIFYIGRRFFRQWKSAVTKGSNVSCCDGCSSCSTSKTCDIKE